MPRQKSFLTEYLLLGAVLVLSYFVYFHKLGDYTVRMWDEARNGVNALEMLENRNFLVTFFGGSPDVWNTKPPLLIWIISIFFKVFGVSEITLRLPSAISALIITTSVFIFSSRILKNKWLGLLSAIILLSSVGFSDIHIARTGDYDALLVLFVFFACIFFFLHAENRNKYFLKLSFVFFALAVLTKGAAGLFMVPGIILYLLISKKFKETLTSKAFWQSFLVFLGVIGSYYLLREKYNPGYLTAVWNNELLGRYGSTTGAQGTDNTFWYYWNYLRNFRFRRWTHLLLFTPVGYFLAADKTTKNWIKFSLTLSVSYFLIISVSGTKNLWYDAQLYPFISILVGLLFFSVVKNFPKLFKFITILAIFALGAKLYLSNLEYIYQPDIVRSDSCIKYGYLLRDEAYSQDRYIWVHKGSEFCMPFHFYAKKIGAGTASVEEISTGDRVLTCDPMSYRLIDDGSEIANRLDLGEGCVGLTIR